MKTFTPPALFRLLFGLNSKQASKEPIISLEFSPEVKELIHLSSEEASRLGDSHVDVHHLILGMLRRGEGGAIDLLTSSKVNIGALKGFLNKHFPDKRFTGNINPPNSFPLTKEAEKVLKICYLEAKILKSTIIGSEHLLLSIFREENSEVVKLLYKYFGISYESLRNLLSPINPTIKDSQIRHTKSEGNFFIFFRSVLGLKRKEENRKRTSPTQYCPNLKSAIPLSHKEATWLGDSRIDIHHLILGMVRQGKGRAIDLLESLGIDMKALSSLLVEHFSEKEGHKDNYRGNGTLPLTERAEKAMKISYLEAKILGSAVVGTEHLLLTIFGMKAMKPFNCFTTTLVFAMKS